MIHNGIGRHLNIHNKVIPKMIIISKILLQKFNMYLGNILVLGEKDARKQERRDAARVSLAAASLFQKSQAGLLAAGPGLSSIPQAAGLCASGSPLRQLVLGAANFDLADWRALVSKECRSLRPAPWLLVRWLKPRM